MLFGVLLVFYSIFLSGGGGDKYGVSISSYLELENCCQPLQRVGEATDAKAHSN
jgi:hypothetical protein